MYPNRCVLTPEVSQKRQIKRKDAGKYGREHPHSGALVDKQKQAGSL